MPAPQDSNPSDSSPRINSARLKSLLDGVNAFGFNDETGGYNRVGFSDADMAVRHWFAAEMRTTGLDVRMDGVANLFGRLGDGDRPCVMAGSHLDTVPEGGAFDGSLGVCVALECVRAMLDAGFRPDKPVEVVVTAEEEGRFGGMLGSQAITGQVDAQWLARARDADGIMLSDAMRAQGLRATDALDCARTPGDVACFLELHVEQGPVLERRGFPIGIASSVSGVCNLEIAYSGEANHSGTTPMDMRADAFAGLAAFAIEIPDIVENAGSAESRITIGKVEIAPNFPHTVPGKAVFTVNIRDSDAEVQAALADAVKSRAGRTAQARGLGIDIRQLSWLDPATLDPEMVSVLREEADRLGYDSLVMPSGAGHDAQTMSAICPSGLIFVPSRNGISHSPGEYTEWADIEKGAQLMLNTLCRLTAS